MVLCVTVTAFCLDTLKVFSLLLSLFLSLYFLHQMEPVVDVRCQEVAEGRSFVRGVTGSDPSLSGCSLLLWRAWRKLQFVCAEGLELSWGSQAGLGSPSGSVFAEFVPLLCSNFAHRGGAEFQPHLFGVLGQALSDIQQNSSYSFSESGIQVYLEN